MSDAEIYRKSELIEEEMNDLLKAGFVEIKDDVDDENLLLDPNHWKVCLSGDKFTFMFDNTYLFPLTKEAKDFCDYEESGIVP